MIHCRTNPARSICTWTGQSAVSRTGLPSAFATAITRPIPIPDANQIQAAFTRSAEAVGMAGPENTRAPSGKTALSQWHGSQAPPRPESARLPPLFR